MSEINVNSIKGVAASTAALTINNTDGTCTANITNNLSNRNLIINGAMQVAQRGTSGSTANGYPSIDRFYTFSFGLDESPTMSQGSLTSSDTPYSSGFRKYLRFQNGNQTSGAGATDQTQFKQAIEGQNVANSGWNYTSSSSFITLSFWIRASVAQTYYGFLKASDGGNYIYPFSIALSANTWTKVTKNIAGNSNLQIDNNTGNGLEFGIYPFLGTSYTDNSVSLDAWGAYNGSQRTPDFTTTWYTTNDSTIDITGVQLEVGSVATDFEHLSFADDLRKCQRYFHKEISSEASTIFAMIAAYTGSNGYGRIDFPVPMRADGSGISLGYSALSDFQALISGSAPTPTQFLTSNRVSSTGGQIFTKTSSGYTIGHAGVLRSANANAFLSFDAEL